MLISLTSLNRNNGFEREFPIQYLDQPHEDLQRKTHHMYQ
jgi:hypothetical protein